MGEGVGRQEATAERRFRFELAAHPGSPAQARRLVRARLTGWSVCEDTCDTAALVISELVTNAIVHSASDVVVCELLDGDDVVRIAVLDEGCSPEEPHPSPQRPEEEHGRGLLLVEALCHSWGAQEQGSGLLVWADLPRAADEPAELCDSASADPVRDHAEPRDDLGWGARPKPGPADGSGDEDEPAEQAHRAPQGVMPAPRSGRRPDRTAEPEIHPADPTRAPGPAPAPGLAEADPHGTAEADAHGAAKADVPVPTRPAIPRGAAEAYAAELIRPNRHRAPGAEPRATYATHPAPEAEPRAAYATRPAPEAQPRATHAPHPAPEAQPRTTHATRPAPEAQPRATHAPHPAPEAQPRTTHATRPAPEAQPRATHAPHPAPEAQPRTTHATRPAPEAQPRAARPTHPAPPGAPEAEARAPRPPRPAPEPGSRTPSVAPQRHSGPEHHGPLPHSTHHRDTDPGPLDVVGTDRHGVDHRTASLAPDHRAFNPFGPDRRSQDQHVPDLCVLDHHGPSHHALDHTPYGHTSLGHTSLGHPQLNHRAADHRALDHHGADQLGAEHRTPAHQVPGQSAATVGEPPVPRPFPGLGAGQGGAGLPPLERSRERGRA